MKSFHGVKLFSLVRLHVKLLLTFRQITISKIKIPGLSLNAPNYRFSLTGAYCNKSIMSKNYDIVAVFSALEWNDEIYLILSFNTQGACLTSGSKM